MGEIKDMESIIKDHPFFQGLSHEYIKLIAGCSSNARFDAGEMVFRSGEDADWFYIVRQGKVALEMWSPERGPITIQTVSDDDVFGWSWLFPPYKWQMDARAVELTRVFKLDGKCLRGKCDKDHHLGYELMKRFSAIIIDRLEASRIQILDVYKTAKEKT
jgi:CRP/FNR family transcriptional regulator, cyclic AMP receptor protein